MLPHVEGTAGPDGQDEAVSRFERALRRVGFRKRFSARRSRHTMPDTEQQKIDASTPQEVSSVRAKSQRHRKSTADKWNQ